MVSVIGVFCDIGVFWAQVAGIPTFEFIWLSLRLLCSWATRPIRWRDFALCIKAQRRYRLSIPFLAVRASSRIPEAPASRPGVHRQGKPRNPKSSPFNLMGYESDRGVTCSLWTLLSTSRNAIASHSIMCPTSACLSFKHKIQLGPPLLGRFRWQPKKEIQVFKKRGLGYFRPLPTGSFCIGHHTISGIVCSTPQAW